LGWFRTISLPHVTHYEIGCRVHTKHEFLPPEPFLRFSLQTCPIHYFRSKTHVWGGFAQFRCSTSTIPKKGVWVHTKHEFLHFFVFRNKHAQSSTLGKNSCLGWFRAISLSHVTNSENGCRGAYKHEFLPPEPFLRFSQRTCPIQYFRSKTHVWGSFAQFRCRTSPIPKTGVGVHTKHKFLPPEPFLRFAQRTCPIHYVRSKTHVWGGFAQFRCRTSPIPKTGVGVHTSTSFCHRNHLFVFRNEHAQSTTLGPKLMFGVVLRNFVAARHQFRKRVSGCIQARVFATGTISSFFAMNMPNPLL
jgi:hypothetical protein